MREVKLKNNNTLPQTLAEALKDAEIRNASLDRRLSAYRTNSRRLRPDFAKAYDDLVERLDVLDRGEAGPKIGEPWPEFVLPGDDGRLHSLASLLRPGPLVVSFNRGHWCPYCKLDLRSLAAIHQEVKRLGAQIVSIMPDSARFTHDLAKEADLPFPILSDIDLGYSFSLGLVFWVGEEVARLYREVGIDLERYQSNPGHFLPMAAKFIVGQDGLVKARQVNIEFRERMTPEEILVTLRELRQQDG